MLEKISFISFLFLVSKLELSSSLNITICSIVSSGGSLPYDYRRSGPAVDMAISALQARFGSQINFQYVYRNPGPGCSSNEIGAIAADVYSKYDISVFIGPGCSKAVDVLGRMAASWNIPMITPVGTSSILGNKNDFKTLTRLAYNMNKFSRFYLEVLSYFSWTDISVMYDKVHVFFEIVGESIHAAFVNAGLSSKLTAFDTNGQFDHSSMLSAAEQRSRVFAIACHGDTFRDIMVTFYRLGMAAGDYVIIFVRLFDGDDVGIYTWDRGDNLNTKARKAYESVFIVQPRRPESAEFLQFEQEVKNRSLIDYNYSYGNQEVNIFITAFYDAVMVYANVLNETLIESGDHKDGINISRKIWGRTFEGISGTIAIDAQGDRDTDFSLLDMNIDTGNFHVVANYFGRTKSLQFEPNVAIQWPNNKGPPPNKPVCGFTGDDPVCKSFVFPVVGIVVIVFAVVLLVFGIIAFVIYRKMKLESDLQSLWWKIKWEDVVIGNRATSRSGSRFSNIQSANEVESQKSKFDIQIFTATGLYKGNVVAIKTLTLHQLYIDREILMQLKQLREINNQNLTRFIGISLKEPSIRIMTEYCSRGSLEDILQNDSITLDWDFKSALMTDLIQGMAYLHNSPITLHGKLNTSNCVIDSRFVLKITDFGILKIRNQVESQNTSTNMRALLWVAPEHLRVDFNTSMSQAGDIYSFGIILFEILTRLEPFEEERETFTIDEIIQKVKTGLIPPFRPKMSSSIDNSSAVKQITCIMQECWNEDVNARPSFSTIKKKFSEVTGITASHNFLDALLRRMEQYANNLEDLVEERTQAFLDEKRKSEELLYEILPRSVADQLKNGASVDPESFECVTIYFSDIVGFTVLSSASTAIQIVDFLNNLYTCFDSIIVQHDVYKVETIGDAYMVVSGLPSRNGDHAYQIASMSLSILRSVRNFKLQHMPEKEIQARIGIHSGPVCAGVVGRKMPRYCLFGDTVNTASRMESHGEAMKIHISSPTKEQLDQSESFLCVERGTTEIKGKGKMTTYWLYDGKDSLTSFR